MFVQLKLQYAFTPMSSAAFTDKDMRSNGSHPTRRRAVFSPLNNFSITDMKTGMGFPLMLSLRRKYAFGS